jgi:hypothetical protein
MKIETNDDVIFLKEVYNTIILKTNEGKCLYLCMRDGGFEMSLDNKNWHIIHSDDDFTKPSLTNPRNLQLDDDIPQSNKSE